MIRRLAISLFCVAMTSAPVEAQRLQPGTEPQQLPGTPTPGFNWDRQYPRLRRQSVPPAARPGQDPTIQTEPAPGPVAPPPAAAPDGAPGPAAPPTAPAGPRGPLPSAFVVPPGLSQPIEHLLEDLGYQAGKTVPLTPHTCFDLAYLCYADGRYADAIVFASHGLTLCNDARLHLIKGVCQLHQGMGHAAQRTATDFQNAIAGQQVFGIDAARERINDAWAVRFADLVEYQATGR